MLLWQMLLLLMSLWQMLLLLMSLFFVAVWLFVVEKQKSQVLKTID